MPGISFASVLRLAAVAVALTGLFVSGIRAQPCTGVLLRPPAGDEPGTPRIEVEAAGLASLSVAVTLPRANPDGQPFASLELVHANAPWPADAGLAAIQDQEARARRRGHVQTAQPNFSAQADRVLSYLMLGRADAPGAMVVVRYAAEGGGCTEYLAPLSAWTDGLHESVPAAVSNSGVGSSSPLSLAPAGNDLVLSSSELAALLADAAPPPEPGGRSRSRRR